MIAFELSGLAQLLHIAAYGLRRNIQICRQFFHRHKVMFADKGEDMFVSLDFGFHGVSFYRDKPMAV
ncbi:Uncharacterised protein [Mycobacteroides abscessus subsp. massiliense]|nr:Uncharacterised protein [Mycobacteroides abscessus subsp. massiliense]